MKTKRVLSTVISSVAFLLTVLVIMFNFNTIFPFLGANSLTLSKGSKAAPKDIPKSLNFLNDDKSAFVAYCKSFYGDKLPLIVSSDSFTYFGSVDGARLYRMQTNIIACSHVQQAESIGGHVFYSDCRYYPSRVGLYVILDDSVFTLEEASSMGIVNIDDIYGLYAEKMAAQYPGLQDVLK